MSGVGENGIRRPELLDPGGLVAAARALVEPGRRRILGITGSPGAGKSTAADLIASGLGPDVVVVPMDGFHLADAELVRIGRRDRKGAPDTFDVGGYAALLRRLRDQVEDVVYAPRFDRDLEDAIAGAVPVPREVPLVVTEGNYLLHDADGWDRIAPLLDMCWYIEVADAVRQERLVRRREGYGDDPAHARAWVMTVDQANADVVAASRDRADRIISLG